MRAQLKYFLLFLMFISNSGFSQDQKIDSLYQALKNAKHDTTRLLIRYEIGERLPILRAGYWDSLVSDSRKANFTKTEGNSLNNVAFVLHKKGDIDNALKYYLQSVNLAEKMGDKMGISTALNNIGKAYEHKGDISNAIDAYAKSLKLAEEAGDKKHIAIRLNNLGVVYETQGDYKAALDYLTRSLKIREEMKDLDAVSISLNNIGLIYKNTGDIPKALEYYHKSLRIRESLGNSPAVATMLHNLGNIYGTEGDVKKGLEYLFKSLEIRRAANNKEGITSTMLSIGEVYCEPEARLEFGVEKSYNEARKYLDSGLVMARKLGFPDKIRGGELMLFIVDSTRKDYRSALEHYKQYIFYRDSINNSETRKASTRSQLKYEYEKKEAVITEQREKEKAVAEEKARFQQVIIVCVILGLVFVLVFAAFVVRSLRTTRLQKTIIEEKQREILDSIHYAKRIQKSLLPTEKHLEKTLRRLKKN